MKNTLFALTLLVALGGTLALSGAKAQPAPVDLPDAAQIAEIRDPAVLTQIINAAREVGNLEVEEAALERRIAVRPHLGMYRLDQAVTYARQDRKSEAYTALIELQGSGYAWDLRGDERFDKIADTRVWGYIVDNLDANREPFGTGRLAWTLPKEDLLIESLTFDPGRKKLLVGSAREGVVYVVAEDGSLQPLASADADNGMWAVFDLAVDAKRKRLWVASTAVPHFRNYDPQKDMGRAGIFLFDLDSGKFIEKYLSPSDQRGSFILSSVVVGSDGAVYAADVANRAIYQVRDGQFRRILHMPMLTAITALAISDDGKRLYMADPQLGILGVELGTLKPFDVRVPAKLTLEGIGALAWHDNALIAVQGSMVPKRVMRLDLSADGTTIVNAGPLEASHPEFGHPGAIALADDVLYVIANEQKDNYDRYGLLKDRGRLEGTRILRIQASLPESGLPEEFLAPFRPQG